MIRRFVMPHLAACAALLYFPAAGLGQPGPAEPPDLIAFGADSGGEVQVFDPLSLGMSVARFRPFGSGYTGRVRVAVGDVNGDGFSDLFASNGSLAGAGGRVSVFNGIGLRQGNLLPAIQLTPFGASFSGGVFVAAGDVNGDGAAEIVVGAGQSSSSGPHVKVFDGKTQALLRSFFAFDAGFRGGVRVATGDVNGDGLADVIVGAGPGGGPHVRVFNGATGAQVASFLAYSASFSGGVFVAAGDVNGDGRADVITGMGATPTGSTATGGHVKVFSGADGSFNVQQAANFLAFDPAFRGGVSVAVGDPYDAGLPHSIIATPAATGSPEKTKLYRSFTPSPLNFKEYGYGGLRVF